MYTSLRNLTTLYTNDTELNKTSQNCPKRNETQKCTQLYTTSQIYTQLHILLSTQFDITLQKHYTTPHNFTQLYTILNTPQHIQHSSRLYESCTQFFSNPDNI